MLPCTYDHRKERMLARWLYVRDWRILLGCLLFLCGRLDGQNKRNSFSRPENEKLSYVYGESTAKQHNNEFCYIIKSITCAILLTLLVQITCKCQKTLVWLSNQEIFDCMIDVLLHMSAMIFMDVRTMQRARRGLLLSTSNFGPCVLNLLGPLVNYWQAQ